MKRQTIHLLSGIPGSGKSYYLDNCIGEDFDHRILHRDDVRAKLREYYNKPDEYFPCSREKEYDAWIAACVSMMTAYPNSANYYFDQTTTGNFAAAKFYNALAIALNNIGIDITSYCFVIEIMDTDYETCIARNAKREGFARVPVNILESMANYARPDYRLRAMLKPPHPMNTTNICIHTIIEDEKVMI